ncbi:prepilin-type N-terminal cleavage/methylation domain-containing protein [Elstera litoralis]|uniref:prepilin-type N-terminal cleavage/methylation domain-containing protein n=1 Tax=Elstera litoralis TaxID=552518 RepID=UPI0006972837|nr:prepilin-type N-terminal cleavage/methylation domain-containing protein [Elstera litoralis]
MTNSSRAAGFTLVETLIALALIALATALIAPNVSRVTGAMGLEGTADDVARALRLARWQALVGGGTVIVTLDPVTHRLIGPTPATSLALPDGGDAGSARGPRGSASSFWPMAARAVAGCGSSKGAIAPWSRSIG